MKWIKAIAFFSTATFITFGSALAHAQARIVQAKVPFAFIVRNRVLPAGTYRISSAGPNLVQIGAIDKAAMSYVVNYSDYRGQGGHDKLLFNKYGDQYFLHEILCDSATISVELPASKLEESARIGEASLHSMTSTVPAVR